MAKVHIDWKKVLVFLFVTGGLVFITRMLGFTSLGSLLMTLGVLLLLFVGDHYAQEIDDYLSKRKKRENDE